MAERLTITAAAEAWRRRTGLRDGQGQPRECVDECERRIRELVMVLTENYHYERNQVIWWVWDSFKRRAQGHKCFLREHLEDLFYEHNDPAVGIDARCEAARKGEADG